MPRDTPAPGLSPQDAFRRNALLILLVCSAAAALCSLILTPLFGLSGLDTLGPAGITLKCAAFVWWLWARPQAFRVIGTVELALEAIVGLYKLSTVLLVDQLSYGLGGYVNWLPLMYVVAALILPGRTALPVSLGLYTVLLAPGIAFGLATHVPTDVKLTFGNTIVQMYILHAAFIGFFALLGRALEAYTTAERQAEHHARLANSDALTGLANRRQLSIWLEEALAAATDGEPLSVLLFDLDHFKRVNDTFGHDVGDEVLRLTASSARDAIREGDLLGRWGGEEFLAILPRCREACAEAVALRLQGALDAAPHFRAGAITVSCGIAQARPGERADDVLRRADVALYAAKRDGRNVVRISA